MPNSGTSPNPPTGGSSNPRHPQAPDAHTETGVDKNKRPRSTGAEGEDGHMGAREDQVNDRSAPSGGAFKDEPRQG
jgi:hypothetical protein